MKLRAAIVSAVAPQTPFRFIFSSGVSSLPLGKGTRHGPIPQLLQQLPTDPMGHGFIASALSKAVLALSLAAFSIISRAAGSILLLSFSAILLPPSKSLIIL
jgi:hypothetical protein